VSNEFSVKNDTAADASAPASAQIRGGGVVGNPPAKRVWRRPAVKIVDVGATRSGFFSKDQPENIYYSPLPMS